MSSSEQFLPQLLKDCAAAGLSISTAESLTGGALAATIVDVPGASAVYYGGVVAYQNSVKIHSLGVSSELLESVGAVDPEVARQMALGACRATGANVGLSTTGVAGPEPHQGKEVGRVYVGLAINGEAIAAEYDFPGSRGEIRAAAVTASLLMLKNKVEIIREQNLEINS